jgi:hypothetical protein
MTSARPARQEADNADERIANMSISKSGNKSHDDAVNAAEGVRQVAVAAASTQAAVNTAEITFYRAAKASALANGCGAEPFISALKQLGTGGV